VGGTDEDSLCEIRNVRCRPEEDLRASRDSNAGPWILGEKEAGKSTLKNVLPARPPSMADEVVVAGRGNYWHAR
jgi:hypothetical protein